MRLRVNDQAPWLAGVPCPVIVRPMPIESEAAYSLWKSCYKPIGLVVCILCFVAVRATAGLLGFAEFFRAFGIFFMLISVLLSFAIMELAERLIFGARVKGPLATWLKVMLAVAGVLGFAMAIFQGIDNLRH